VAVEIRNIKSLQVFNTICEVMSVTLAAERLNISQSSVSYHIKKLETDLGVVLFQRAGNGVTLTDAGSLLNTHVERGLASIRTGLSQIQDRAETVRVAVLPMFASRWLSSRLGGLLEMHPDMQLAIKSHNNSFAKTNAPELFADLGIQWGLGRWDQFEVTRLWPEKLVVVCSPDYQRKHMIKTPDDLQTCTLLHVDDTRMWEEWFASNGGAMSSAQTQMMLEDRHFQLSSTSNGLGVSLFASWVVQNELDSGELVDPFGQTYDTAFAYFLVAPKAAKRGEAERKFQDWLLDACRVGGL